MTTTLKQIFNKANKNLTSEAFHDFIVFAYGAQRCALEEKHELKTVILTLKKQLNELLSNPDNIWKV